MGSHCHRLPLASEEENRNLKQLVANLSLDKKMLQDVQGKKVLTLDRKQDGVALQASVQTVLQSLLGELYPRTQPENSMVRLQRFQ